MMPVLLPRWSRQAGPGASSAAGGALRFGPRRCSLARVDQVSEADHGAGDMDIGELDGAEGQDTSLRRRHEEISERIEQLHERREQLSERSTRGSTAHDATEAQAFAEQAHEHAQHAHERTARRHTAAAELHEHVAAALDEHGRDERAQAHRKAAAHDRAAASDEDQAADEEQRETTTEAP